MTVNNIYIDFAKIYLDGSPCDGCTWQKRCAGESGCTSTVQHCAEQLEKTIKEMNREFARNANRIYRK
jgi:hypothetical protein